MKDNYISLSVDTPNHTRTSDADEQLEILIEYWSKNGLPLVGSTVYLPGNLDTVLAFKVSISYEVINKRVMTNVILR